MTFAIGCNTNKPVGSLIKDSSRLIKINGLDTTLKKMGNLSLTPFPSVPDTIDGCGDYYSLDTGNISSNKYVFLSRMREVAVIILNGNTTYLNIDTTLSKSTDNIIHDIYTGKDGLKVILKVRKFKEFDEGAFYKGELIIKKGTSQKNFKVHGQTGC